LYARHKLSKYMCKKDFILMKLILPLSSLIHYHIIKSAYMLVYLMSMKPPLRLA
jgi:hypothetical protein